MTRMRTAAPRPLTRSRDVPTEAAPRQGGGLAGGAMGAPALPARPLGTGPGLPAGREAAADSGAPEVDAGGGGAPPSAVGSTSAA